MLSPLHDKSAGLRREREALVSAGYSFVNACRSQPYDTLSAGYGQEGEALLCAACYFTRTARFG